MPSEAIYKLQPTRTVHLGGFDRRGAAAALHSASESGFVVSGVFRDQADAAVVVLWDADNRFEHRSMRYLPDFDFSGMALTFDLTYSGLQPIHSLKHQWLPWGKLSCQKADGQGVELDLWERSVLQAGSFPAASATWRITGAQGSIAFFYRDIPFVHTANGGRTVDYTLYTQAVGYEHFLRATGLDLTITGATNASPIQITTSTPHGLGDYDIVIVDGVQGNTAANGAWFVLVQDATHFTLTGSTGNGAYTSGGKVGKRRHYSHVQAAGEYGIEAAIDIENQAVSDPHVIVTSCATKAINGVSGNGVSPIRIETSGDHGMKTGFAVKISGVGGNTAANGVFFITVDGGRSFTLDGTTGNGDWTGGGTINGSNHLLVSARSGVEALLSASDGNADERLATASGEIASAVAYLINNYDWPYEGPATAIIASADGADLTIKAARYGRVNVEADGVTVNWHSGHKFTAIPAGSALYMNGERRVVASVQNATRLTLEAPGTGGALTQARYLAELGGRDGDMVAVQCRATGGLSTDGATSLGSFMTNDKHLTGGEGNPTWRVTVNFTADGIDQLRRCWLTLAPPLRTDTEYLAAEAGNPWNPEFQATVANWTVTDPNGKRALKIAGPGSVRVPSRNEWVTYTGSGWAEEAGWFADGYARRSSTAGDKVRVRYTCQSQHSLWIGTSLYRDRGKVDLVLDGVPVTDPLDTYVDAEEPILTRRRVATDIAAGAHELEITIRADKNPASLGTFFYLDYLEAAVLADVQDPPAAYTTVSPALDFDTDHTYKMSPQRLVWNLDRMGFHGDVNEYVGVFWWNQRKRTAGTTREYRVVFDGTWAENDWVRLTVSGIAIHKSLTAHDVDGGNAAVACRVLARALADFMNSSFVGVWASASSNGVLTVRMRSETFSFATTLESSSAQGTASAIGNLNAGAEGVWTVDHEATPVLNRAARDWHADLYAEVVAKGWTITSALSMELLNPPDDPDNGQVWAARYRDGVRVLTSTGFGTEALATITGASNATPIEITAEGHGYETGDSITVTGVGGNTAANSPLDGSGNRVPWVVTRTGPDTFTLAGSAGNGDYTSGGTCWRNLKTAHCSFVPAVTAYQKQAYKELAALMDAAGLVPWLQFGEFVWWFFTNHHETQNPAGGMAFYDADTTAAAQAALGRPLAAFLAPTDDPAVNGSADANFLRQCIKDHCDAISGFVKATYPAARFEVLWPYDVNYPTPTRRYKLGGRLNRYVNLPSQWQTKAGSGLDRIKMEGLAFGSSERDLDKAKETIRFPYASLTWPKADTRYLLPWFNGGCPWVAEYLFALAEGTPHVNLWAFDHLCLLTWPVPLPTPPRSVRTF